MKKMYNPLKLNEMKKSIAILMLLLMGLTSMAQTSVWDGSRAVWTRGAGTENNPYLIESASHLAFLAYMVNKGFDTYGLHFRLTTDIDLNGGEDQQWVPIGLGYKWFNEDGCDRGYAPNGFYPNTFFRGHFDGGEHSISNIYIDTDGVAGLFGFVRGTSNDDLAIIENVYVTSGSIRGNNCGGIVGWDYGKTQISRCWNGASIEGSESSGGIVGRGSHNIYNCYNIGNVSSNNYAGGIVGQNAQEVIECYNEGEVNGTYAGGIFGYTQSAGVVIDNCYNKGSIMADGDNVPSGAPVGPAAGGIAAFLFRNSNMVSNCYNVGEISSTQDMGCIVAYTQGTVENCYYLTSTCTESEYGEPKDEDYMRSQEFVDLLNSRNRDQKWGLDVDNINDGFPILVEDNLAVSEVSETAFLVYPNPAKSMFTVEGVGLVRITNVMGQHVGAREINGQGTFVLPRGMYFVTLNGKTRKVVVE